MRASLLVALAVLGAFAAGEDSCPAAGCDPSGEEAALLQASAVAKHKHGLNSSSCAQADEGLQPSDLNEACRRSSSRPDLNDCTAEAHGSGGDCWKCNCGGTVEDPGKDIFGFMLDAKGADAVECCISNKCAEPGASGDCNACHAYVIRATGECKG